MNFGFLEGQRQIKALEEYAYLYGTSHKRRTINNEKKKLKYSTLIVGLTALQLQHRYPSEIVVKAPSQFAKGDRALL